MGLCLFGALKPTGGTVQLDGQLIRSKSPEHALADGIGYLTEDRKGRGLFGGLSVGENIVISHLKPFKRAGFLARSAMDQAADDAVRQFDIRTPDTTRAIRVLSGGNQQKALLARLLQHNLKVLILDEPTRGVDVGARAEIYSIINRLAADGVGIIMISSELPELLGTCDRIMVMCEGRRTGTLDVRDATQEKIMHLASPEKTTTEAA
jgi:ribose transport system ATP-binding protein